jgi:hypothetical protein
LTASYGVSAWIEFLLLRRGMARRIGAIPSPSSYFARLWFAAISSAALAWAIRYAFHPHRPRVAALVILIPYAVFYLGITAMTGIDQAGSLLRRLRRA